MGKGSPAMTTAATGGPSAAEAAVRSRRTWLGALGALAVAGGCVPLVGVLAARSGLGPAAQQAAAGLLLACLVAPALAHGLIQAGEASLRLLPGADPLLAASLLPATLFQAALLGLWHLEALPRGAALEPAHALAMRAGLLLAAAWFWLAVPARRSRARWPAVAALLATGAAAGLFALLLMAPATSATAALADRQLAGALTLCLLVPLCLVAGLAAAGRGLAGSRRGR